MKADLDYYAKPYEAKYSPQKGETKNESMNIYLRGRNRAHELFSSTREQLIERMGDRNRDILDYLKSQQGVLY